MEKSSRLARCPSAAAPFEFFIAAVIAVNAVFLAVLTMPNITSQTREVAMFIDAVAMGIYIAELIVRILSYGAKP